MKHLSAARLTLLIVVLALIAALAPAINLEAKTTRVINGGFETGDFTGWVHGGVGNQAVEAYQPYFGDYSARLGVANSVEPTGFDWLYQGGIVVPNWAISPTLHFAYRLVTYDTIANDYFQVDILDQTGVTLTNVLVDGCTVGCGGKVDLGWQIVSVDMTPYQGQEVRLWFGTMQNGNGSRTWVYLDDVALNYRVLPMPVVLGVMPGNSVRVLGTAEPGVRVQASIKLPGAAAYSWVGSTGTDAVGNWAISLPTSAGDGVYLIRFLARDGGDIVSPWTEPITYDTLAPLRTLVLQQGNSDVADTTINAWAPTTNAGNSAALLLRTADVKNSLLRFDLAPISPTHTIEKATLSLFVENQTNPAAFLLEGYLLKRGFVANQATWNLAATGVPWGSPGANDTIADREGVPFDTTLVMTSGRWVHLDVTDVVKAWQAAPATNYGLLLKAFAARQAVEYSFDSSQSPRIERRPKISVIYKP